MLTITKDSATIGTSEYYLASDSTVKTSQTTECWLQVVIDLGNLVAGDVYEIRSYVTINGTERTIGPYYVSGVQSEPFVSQPMLVGEGWEWSVKKQSGVDRSIGWSIRKEATGDATAATQTSHTATLATMAGYIDTEVASIKTTVEALPSAATVAAAVLAEEVEAGFSLGRYQRVIAAAVAGQRDADGNFDSLAGTEDQIVGTAGDGTRTGITYGA